MTHAIDQSSSSTSVEIEGITEPTILKYFETLNAGEFEATGALFAVDGALQPPFDQPLIGPEAIAAYLQTEAKGFLLQPKRAVARSLEDGCTEVDVVGSVQTPLFGVNVSWRFILSPQRELRLAKIKLLASLKELLDLRHPEDKGTIAEV